MTGPQDFSRPGNGLPRQLDFGTRRPALAAESRRCDDCRLNRIDFCNELSPELGRMGAGAKWADLPAGHTLWTEDTNVQLRGILISGLLRIVRFAYDGRRHVMSLILPAEFVSDGILRPGFTLEAATPVRLCRLNPHAHDRLLRESSRFRRLVYHQAELDLDRLRYFTWSIGSQSPEQRIAAFLYICTRIMRWQPLPTGGGILTLELSRRDIADLLATSIETISRVTRRFHRDGLIVIHDDAHIEIPRPDLVYALGDTENALGAFDLPAGDGPADLVRPVPRGHLAAG